MKRVMLLVVLLCGVVFVSSSQAAVWWWDQGNINISVDEKLKCMASEIDKISSELANMKTSVNGIDNNLRTVLNANTDRAEETVQIKLQMAKFQAELKKNSERLEEMSSNLSAFITVGKNTQPVISRLTGEITGEHVQFMVIGALALLVLILTFKLLRPVKKTNKK